MKPLYPWVIMLIVLPLQIGIVYFSATNLIHRARAWAWIFILFQLPFISLNAVNLWRWFR